MERIAALGIGQKTLGAITGIAQGTVSNAVGGDEPKGWQFEYVERLSFFLDIPLPLDARLLLLGDRARQAGGRDSVEKLVAAFEGLLPANR